MLKINSLYKFNIYGFWVFLCGFFVFDAFNQLAIADDLRYSKYQVEIIVFKRLNYKNSISTNYGPGFNKEIFHFIPLKYNKNKKYLNFNDHGVQIKFLTKEAHILSKTQEYKIILQGAVQYNVTPSEKTKKFLIKSDGEINYDASLNLAQQNKGEHFIATLVITAIRNNTFNLAFDANFDTFSLKKSAKIKSKEIYYFDHPMFGALIGINELK